MNKAAFSVVAAGAVVVGLAFRLGWLDLRPIHHDEANQAVRFGQLLETGDYRYDRNDHHGPTLYYLTLPVAWARGQATLASLDERTLRVVPALFGAGFILLLPLVARGLGRGAVAVAMLLAALSPALTYYSRFYIQESVLLFFIVAFLVALGRYAAGGGVAAMIAAGVCAGLALATKETAAPILLAGVAACAAARASVATPGGATGERADAPWPRIRVAHVVGAVVLAALVAVTLFSSFFTNLSGVADAVRAGAVYAQRGFEPGTHGEPWNYYLRLLGYSRSGGIVWTEGLVLVLAGVGAAFAWTKRAGGFWPRYLCLYSAITLVAFSAVRYKTPWNLLTLLRRGHGAGGVWRGATRRSGALADGAGGAGHRSAHGIRPPGLPNLACERQVSFRPAQPVRLRPDESRLPAAGDPGGRCVPRSIPTVSGCWWRSWPGRTSSGRCRGTCGGWSAWATGRAWRRSARSTACPSSSRLPNSRTPSPRRSATATCPSTTAFVLACS